MRHTILVTPHARFGGFIVSRIAVPLLALGALTDFSIAISDEPMQPKWDYPAARKDDTIDRYHGVAVADPFRWMEEPQSEELTKWITAQNSLTNQYLEKIAKRETIRKRLEEIWNYDRYGLPQKRGDRYFFSKISGLQNQPVLMVADGLQGAPRVLLDPNAFEADGVATISRYTASDDGKRVAVAIAKAGSDWNEWIVLDADSGKRLADKLEWVKFSGASWTPDSAGFFYSRYDAPKEGAELTQANYYQKLFYHRVGDQQADDQLIYKRDDFKEWGFDGGVTDDGKFLVVSIWRGSEAKNQIFYKPLGDASSPMIELLSGFDSDYDFVDNDAASFLILTDKDAPKKRLVKIDLSAPAPSNWKTVIPESKDTLISVSRVGDRLFAQYLEDAHSKIVAHKLDGSIAFEVKLPAIGSADGFRGRAQDHETFFTFTNYATPTTIFRLDTETGATSVHRASGLSVKSEDFVTRQEFLKSRDGTKIPITLTYRRDLSLDGKRPTVLYGYGGFNVSVTPAFSPETLAWLEMGGVYAVANLRGGSEYGSEWHEQGMKGKKQNVFDDFISAAEWLIEKGVTSRDRLAIRGASNGGLLVGAAITQRPDLFRAAVPAVGVFDMLRYHKFTIGWAWAREWGSSDEPDAFQYLYAYSPLHRAKEGAKYPATLIVTGDHDDRVVPAHSFKFGATLQSAQGGPLPILVRIETRAGHGAGKPTSKRIAEATDALSFLVKELGVE